MGKSPLLGKPEATLIDTKLTEKQLKKAGLAGAIGADKGDFLAGMNARRGVVQ